MEGLRTLLRAPRELLLCLACEYADSFSTFALDYVFVLYLTAEFGFSDTSAGWLYGLYGVMVLIYGVVLGPMIDNLKVKRTLIVGSVLAAVARISLVFVTRPALLLGILFLVLPVGVGMTSNVLKLSIRRYTTKSNRSIAFNCSYTVINYAALASAVLLTFSRALVTGGTQYFRTYLLLAFGCCIGQVALACCLREIVVDEDTEVVKESTFERSSFRQTLVEVRRSITFWKFVGISFLVCTGNGAAAPFEVILSVNPLLILLLMPFVSLLQLDRHMSAYEQLILGTMISALSMFIMGISLSAVPAAVAMGIFTVGEMIWAPRFLEMSVMVGKEGKEGTGERNTGHKKDTEVSP